MPEQAIILAAGLGNRMLPLTQATPKGLVPVGGVPIVVNALDHFAAAGVKKIVLVVGHLAEKFPAALGRSYRGMALEYVENPRFAETNSMYSLWQGLTAAPGATWVLEGDVFFEARILSLAGPGEFRWYADSSARSMDGAFLIADGQGRAAELKIIREKGGLRPPGHYKSIGLLELGPGAVERLRGWLERGVGEGKVNLYYDLIVAEHLRESAVMLVDVAGCKWFEIDDLADLAQAEALFAG